MRTVVHKKLDTKRFATFSKLEIGVLCIAACPMVLLLVFAVGIGIWTGRWDISFQMILWDAVLAGIVIGSCFLSLQSGYVDFGEYVIFHNITGCFQHRNIQYDSIAFFTIGYCPSQFIKRKNKYQRYSHKEWESMYGTYITAFSQEQEPLFLCRYEEDVWEFLTKRCRNTPVFVWDAKTEQAYWTQKMQADGTYCEIRTMQEIQNYDGYIN